MASGNRADERVGAASPPDYGLEPARFTFHLTRELRGTTDEQRRGRAAAWLMRQRASRIQMSNLIESASAVGIVEKRDEFAVAASCAKEIGWLAATDARLRLIYRTDISSSGL